MTEIYTTYEDDNKKKPKTKLGKLVKRAFSYNHGTRKRIWELDILRGILMIFYYAVANHFTKSGVKIKYT